MNFMSFFKRPSTAPVARERLQILLAHERAVVGKSDVIAILQDEIVAVIAKHFPVEPEAIKVKMERGEVVSTLEVEVEIPTPMCVSLTVNKGRAKAAAPKAPANAKTRAAETDDADETDDEEALRPIEVEEPKLSPAEASAEADS